MRNFATLFVIFSCLSAVLCYSVGKAVNEVEEKPSIDVKPEDQQLGVLEKFKDNAEAFAGKVKDGAVVAVEKVKDGANLVVQKVKDSATYAVEKAKEAHCKLHQVGEKVYHHTHVVDPCGENHNQPEPEEGKDLPPAGSENAGGSYGGRRLDEGSSKPRGQKYPKIDVRMGQ